jgi:hypothetical protein
MAGWLRRHNQQSYSCMRAQVSPRKTRSKGTWEKVGQVSQVVGGVLSLVIAIAAWQAARDAADSARDAADSARKATQIQETTSLLNVEPHLQVEAAFNSFGNPPSSPRILLWNSGKVDAVAVTVQMNIWEGEIQSGGVPTLGSMQEPIPQWPPVDIASYKTHIIPVSTPSTQPHAGLPEELRKRRHRFIELIIRYLRAADRKSYEQRSYYFVGPTGIWVGENYPESDHIEFNRRIKKALEHPEYLKDLGPLAFDKAHFTSK